MICGGPRVTNRLASELGYDAGFGRGTLPSEVAAFIAVTLARALSAEAVAHTVEKTALVTGITGQDGSYLAELLLEKGYRVVGMTRRTSTEVHERIEHIVDDVEIVSGDLLDQSSITSIVSDVAPDEIYNLAAQSFVPASWSQPVLTGEFTALGVTRVLEAIRQVNPSIRFYQASSSEMFGNAVEIAAERDDGVLSAQSLRRRKGLRPLDHGQLSRIVRSLRLQRHLFQSRVASHLRRRSSIRRNDVVDVVEIGELLHVREKGPTLQRFDFGDALEVWDGERFVRVLGRNCLPAPARRSTTREFVASKLVVAPCR